ncbi:MAG: SIS domain-containing protein [Propionibacteriaceae bacterium]|jgi:uncharacterized phosphosugar-binding protein|nr:SIS domain-containing protein [Propionibacteriaceae bacterium]
MTDLDRFDTEITTRLQTLHAFAADGGLDQAITILATSLAHDGVLQAFGTGHSAAFAMEIAGRAGGFIPTHALRLQDLVLLGVRPLDALESPELERDHTVADQLYDLYDIRPADAFLIASNSGANGSTVGLALRAQREGHPVIAVTSLVHSRGVASKHPSGKRLFEVADVVLDNLAPYGDATLDSPSGIAMGAVSSITAAYLAQLLTVGTAAKLEAEGLRPPLYVSANVPGGDEHNRGLEDQFGVRIKPFAHLDEIRARLTHTQGLMIQ